MIRHEWEVPLGLADAVFRRCLKIHIKPELYGSWFRGMKVEKYDGKNVVLSVPVKFVRDWIRRNYQEDVEFVCAVVFEKFENVDVVWRQPGSG